MRAARELAYQHADMARQWASVSRAQLVFVRTLRSLVVASFGGLACVSGRAFVPAEHVTALSPQGRQLAAEYTIREESRLVAEAKVWTKGATRNASEEDDGATVVYVGFEIQNHTNGPVRLDTKRLFLDDVKIGAGTLTRVPLLRVSGATEIRPGEEGEALAAFRLPSEVWPSELLSYRVAWTLTNGGVYQQKTPFVAAVTRYADDWGPYYYNPYPTFYFGAYPSWYWPYRYRTGPGWRYRRYYPYYP